MANNVFQENDANLGKSIDSRGFEGTIDLSNNTFDIFSSENSSVSDYWVKLGDASAEFSGSYGEEEFQYGEVYVDPEVGDDDVGSGDLSTPYKTIGNALLNCFGLAGSPFIVHLSEGVYDIDSGECFPIQLPSNVSLIVAGPDLTIIDASSSNNVFYLDNVYGFFLKYTKSPMEAEDLSQDVFIKLYKSLKHFRFESEFKTYLFRISLNTAHSYVQRDRWKNLLHIDEIPEPGEKDIHTENQYLAHIYVRYLGDLRGGQMIAKKVPGTGKYYKFEEPKVLAESIYTKLDDSMADEAKIVFEFATKQFQELYAGHFQNPKKV